ncbi:hypothetical protein PTSG_00895 [Salpingoeca rosetta]|uniref:Uncharacterized protein n=1 Tax=Salpingoeca rosetta (strain ATCC 50818 / BSB-021) TaxID=946362 RepID=F2TXS9_SALR5|nr:uncharacterized protein PTSG_00895 [Salpingoeca rosetta]EGD76188.1 hypothetical protein PTSG_00895 [Salpingoeca rosetta]|eukprot:XP_004998363.1 hypothetical protein PTSG_00895 [Salpingoeca rosetta]
MVRRGNSVTDTTEAFEMQHNPDPVRQPSMRSRSGSSNLRRRSMTERKASSNAQSRQFERRRADQVRIWSENRPFFAAKAGLLKVLQKFEESSFASHEERVDFYVNNRDPVGATVLHVTILCESLDVAKYLIKTYGAKLVRQPYESTPPSPYEGETALHLAIVKRQYELAKMLVQYGADINAHTTGTFFDQEISVDKGLYFGSTPLHFAVCSGDLRMAEYLLNHNADASLPDSYGNTALHLCVVYEDQAMYDLVASRDQAFEGKLRVARNNDGLTPLKLAASLASATMFKHILHRNRELNWAFGPIKEYLYPLKELDSVEKEGVLDILVQHGSLEHATLLKLPPLHDMLAEKWSRFAKFAFGCFIMIYMVVIACLIAALYLTQEPNSYSSTQDLARLLLEIIVVFWVTVDTVAFEIPELVRYVRHGIRPSQLYAGSFVFVMSNWLFRAMLVICIVLRVSDAQANVQRTFLSFLAVLGMLYLLHFARGVRAFSKFILMTERMVIDMRFWTIVFAVELVGFALGFQLLFNNHDPHTGPIDLETMWIGMFTLVKWTMGEFNFTSNEVEVSISQPASYILFIGFVILSSTVLFNILIALMTSTFQTYDAEATTLSTMQWATTIISIEYKLRRIGVYSKKWRTGTPGEDCGGRPNEFYKVTLVYDAPDKAKRDSEGGVSPTKHEAKKHVPGYPSTYHDRNVDRWDTIMRRVNSDSPSGNYIEDYSEMVSIFELYEVMEQRSVNRETAAFILQDLVFNNALNPTEELKNTVLKASQVVAAELDPDGDDDIPYETLATFCRLSRMSLIQRKNSYETRRHALIVVDCQNDFTANGAVPVTGYHKRNVINQINALREQFPWDLVVMTQDWHPRNHISFKGSELGRAVYDDDEDVVERRCHNGDLVYLPDDVDDMIWPPHCIQNTDGADFVPELMVKDDDIIVRKAMDPAVDSYSAFWDNARKSQTRLFEHLFNHQIEDVFIVGLGFDCAVGRTARDAATYGFNTHVIEDCTCWFDDRWRNEMHLELFDAHVQVIKTTDIIAHRERSSFVVLDSNTISEISSRSKKVVRKRPTQKFVRRTRMISHA